MKTLILSASFGSGHHQANEAMGQALQALLPSTQARQTDFLRHLRRYERSVVLGTYLAWLRHSPETYRWYYHFTDRESEPKTIRDTYKWMGRQGLRRELLSYQPQVVVSSYPTPAAVAGHLRARDHFDFLNVLVVTDYRVHQHWVRPEADLLLVPTPETGRQMVERGIPQERVVVTGIPIHPRYRELIGADKAALRLKHGLDPELPLLLMSGGGQGTYRSLEKVLRELGALGRAVQVLVLAAPGGAQVQQWGGATIHRLGFTNAFPELLAASDLVVGKAGGLTVAEATTLGVPMVIYDPIPGQEEYNAEYLVRGQAAIWTRTLAEVRPAVLGALEAAEQARLSAGARQLGVPDAADRAARAILSAFEARQLLP
ncbi:UDP-N-acetylglucosamine--LPS N-acetylglucosamine transferase [Deinococcus irradiatisoli]|uniref:UDP-N-acetylglucosamine--LPS N-acetylglucosamine transferase n=1 Tax=Deinococcus irradiatisoli TaxID=2202254 RepID=A0A2Z3JTB1_9DEIO|nr:UDP-N-acetylglucosamine--LPS N-acetylglucosamine transferase [Deinococcus irradiatisoli]